MADSASTLNQPDREGRSPYARRVGPIPPKITQSDPTDGSLLFLAGRPDTIEEKVLALAREDQTAAADL